ncbi:MAG TPA: glycosyltransferase family 2 protein [Polyangiaceae bacterium]|nr:glycosyltransferase family 2 protein [Polyangiaceae bacterium]
MSSSNGSYGLDLALAAALGRPRTVLIIGSGGEHAALISVNAGAKVTLVVPHASQRPYERLLSDVIELDPQNTTDIARALASRRFDLVIVPKLNAIGGRGADLIRTYSEWLEPEGRLLVRARNTSALGANSPTENGAAAEVTRQQVDSMIAGAGLQTLWVESSSILTRSLARQWRPDSALSGKLSREMSVLEMYLASARPVEVSLTSLAPQLFAVDNWVIARQKPKAGKLSLTVGMLTMDEEPSVARMIDEIKRYAPDAQILCVDSSMKDQTPVIAEKMGARVLRQLPPRGHGPAMELLMYEAAKQSDALIYLDCDFTYPPAVIPAIREILDSGVDVVNASRITQRPEAMPLANYLANKTFVSCARMLNGMPVGDLHSGMRGYRSSVIRSFSFDGEGDALPIDTLLWPARCGYHVVEIPIEYQERVGFSKLRKVAGTVWTFIRLGKTLGVGSRRKDTYDVWKNTDTRS